MVPRIRSVGLVAWLAIFADLVLAATVTVDDANPVITYSADWNIGNTCSGCFAQPPEHNLINAQTWHDATRGTNSSEIWFQTGFTGTAVTVYGILIDIVETAFVFTTNVDLNIEMDGETTRYTYTPESRNSYQYQVPVFAKTGLSNTAHTMRVTLNPSSAFLFDYIMYTTPDTSTSSVSTSVSTASTSTEISPSVSLSTSTSTSTSPRSTLGSLSVSIDASGSTRFVSPTADASSSGLSTISIGAIVGIVAGVVGVLFVVIAILLFLLCRKRRRSRQSISGDHGVSEPFMAQSTQPTTFLHMFSNSSHGASTSGVALNDLSTTPFVPSGNLNPSFNSPIGAASEAAGVTSIAAMTMTSKQRRMQDERALLPAQQPQRHHYGVPARVTGRGGQGTAYSEGTGAGASVYGGIETMSSHTGSMSTSSGNTEHYDSSASTPLSRPAAPGVGGRVAPWNMGLYPHGIPAPVQLAAPVPVPLGVPMDSGRDSEDRSRSVASGVTRPPTAPPPYIRSPPPLSAAERTESIGGGLESVSENNEKR